MHLHPLPLHYTHMRHGALQRLPPPTQLLQLLLNAGRILDAVLRLQW